LITKFLIVGKQVFLQSKAPTSHEDQGTALELLLPLEDYWKLTEKLKSVTFLLASGETQNEISTVLKEVFKICSKYAVAEKDRLWLHAKLKEP
jgi:hypothetical protein